MRCTSVADVVAGIALARTTGGRLAVRGGGHCFAGRSTTDGVLLDMSGLDAIDVADDGVATIGAGARLAQVYSALHEHGRTVPAGCGATVGIAGLTLGGGIGLLGRRYGLTCDRLVGADAVLADGRVIRCDIGTEPDLFWALRGAGGGQFGVVTALRFDTVAEPLMARVHLPCPDADIAGLVAAWQSWAPDAPDELTLGLTVARDPGGRASAVLAGACLLGETATRDLLAEFASLVSGVGVPDVRAGVPYHRLKSDLDDPREHLERTLLRSEFFARPLRAATVEAVLDLLAESDPPAHRRLAFTALGGAYNRVAPDATAFAHRSERFLLEHVGALDDPWVDASWSAAHADGSGRVYPNFPDPALDDPSVAYHGTNLARLVAVKDAYDPNAFFDFPQAIRPSWSSAGSSVRLDLEVP